MNKLFIQILNMSVTSCYVIIFVMLLRLMLKKAPKIFSYILWYIAFFKLICPLSFKSSYSILPDTTFISQSTIAQLPRINSSANIVNQSTVSTTPGFEISLKQIFLYIGEAVWLIGIILLIIYSLISIIKLYKGIKFAKPVYGNIYEVSGLKTPFVFGFLKPKIILPNTLSEKEKGYIIKHEQTHIKRLDHIIKPVAFLIVCIHWFNPLAWIAFSLMSEDMELSCDESVLRHMGNEIKRDYSQSLLNLSTNEKGIRVCPVTFAENNTKGRIINIMKYKKPTLWIILICTIIIIIAAIGLISNPMKKGKHPENLDKTGNSSVKVEENTTKSIDFSADGKELSLSVDFPNYISDYIKLNVQKEKMEDQEYNVVYFDFEKGDQTANIGVINIFTKEQYEILKSQLTETETITDDNYVLTFYGLQSAPFELSTEEGKLVDQYQSDLKDIIQSIKLSIK